jgi:hypothetical protein
MLSGRAWLEANDADWLKRGGDEGARFERFQTRWRDRACWAVSFRVARDVPLLLAPSGSPPKRSEVDHGVDSPGDHGYVMSPFLALPDEPEAVDEGPVIRRALESMKEVRCRAYDVPAWSPVNRSSHPMIGVRVSLLRKANRVRCTVERRIGPNGRSLDELGLIPPCPAGLSLPIGALPSRRLPLNSHAATPAHLSFIPRIRSCSGGYSFGFGVRSLPAICVRFAPVLVRGVCRRALRSGVSVSLSAGLRPRTASGPRAESLEMAMASKAEVASNTKKLKDLRLMAHDRGAWDELAPKRDSTTDGRLLKLASSRWRRHGFGGYRSGFVSAARVA